MRFRSFFYKGPQLIQLGFGQVTFHDHIRRDLLGMFARPIHPPLDGIFVKTGDPGRRPNAALFGDDRQGLQDLLPFRTQPVEKGPFGLRKGLATAPDYRILCI